VQLRERITSGEWNASHSRLRQYQTHAEMRSPTKWGTDSEGSQKRGRFPLGISGRAPSDWVTDVRWNQWLGWIGIRSLRAG